MMTREYQPMSNSYSAPTSKEDASSCLPSNVTPLEITRGPQFDVSMSTSGVDADPLDPPDAVLGSADATTQRTLSIAIESNTGLSSTPPTTTTIRRKATKDHQKVLGLVAFGSAWSSIDAPVLGISWFTLCRQRSGSVYGERVRRLMSSTDNVLCLDCRVDGPVAGGVADLDGAQQWCHVVDIDVQVELYPFCGLD